MKNSPPKAGKGQMYHTTHTVWTKLFAVHLFSQNLWQKLQSLLMSSLYNLYQSCSLLIKHNWLLPHLFYFYPQHLLVKGVGIIPWHVLGDNNSDDKAIDSDDTRHNDRDDRLHDELRAHHRHGRDACAGLGSAIGSSQCWKWITNL